MAEAQTPLQLVVSHLELIGYRSEGDETGVTLKHDIRPLLRLYSLAQIVVILVPFNIGAAAKADSSGFLSFLNKVNVQSSLAKFFLNVEMQTMFAQSCYAGPYDKTAFGTFFDAFMHDVWTPAESFSDEAKKYLS